MERLRARRPGRNPLSPQRLQLQDPERQVLLPPTDYLDAVRRLLDFIEFDPCSTDACQKVVDAHRWYRAEDAIAVLDEPWSGRVFLHPHPNVVVGRHQLQKLLREYLSGRITSAVVLAGRGDWLRQEPLLLSFPWMIHYRRLPHRRLDASGTPRPFTPTHNSITHYLPAKDGLDFDEDRLALFVESFSCFGRVVLAEDLGNDWEQDALLATARMPMKPLLTKRRLDRYTTRAERAIQSPPQP